MLSGSVTGELCLEEVRLAGGPPAGDPALPARGRPRLGVASANCAEDIVSMKILAGRAKDEDATSVIAAQGSSLDLDRVRETLQLLQAALDVSALLPRLDDAVRVARRIR
ncbi:MAG: hypothetical protein HYY06_00275 [Deltaproteobacteria bacterium]|nr:hypothetical protein [Deltaproteobacteria bacterium]